MRKILPKLDLEKKPQTRDKMKPDTAHIVIDFMFFILPPYSKYYIPYFEKNTVFFNIYSFCQGTSL